MRSIDMSISYRRQYLGLRTLKYQYPLSIIAVTYESEDTERQSVKVEVGYAKEGILSYKTEHQFPQWVDNWLLTEFKLSRWK
jgi:hypothetical protein